MKRCNAAGCRGSEFISTLFVGLSSVVDCIRSVEFLEEHVRSNEKCLQRSII